MFQAGQLLTALQCVQRHVYALLGWMRRGRTGSSVTVCRASSSSCTKQPAIVHLPTKGACPPRMQALVLTCPCLHTLLCPVCRFDIKVDAAAPTGEFAEFKDAVSIKLSHQTASVTLDRPRDTKES